MFDVLTFLKKLEYCCFRHCGVCLAVLEDFDKLKESLVRTGIDTSRSVDDIQEGDIGFLLDCLHVVKSGDLMLLHYTDEVEHEDAFMVYNGILYEMRGIIVDVNTFTIVSLPFRKFGSNLPDIALAEELNGFVEYTEKLEGKLIQASWYKGELVLATEYMFDCKTLDEVRRYISSHNEYECLIEAKEGCTVLFQWVSSSQEHVIPYEGEVLRLIGVRHIESRILLSYEKLAGLCELYHIPGVQVCSLSYEDASRSIEECLPGEMVGYIVNIEGRLYNMESPAYSTAKQLIHNDNYLNKIVRAIGMNSYSKLYSEVPYWMRDELDELRTEVYDYVDLATSYVNAEVDKVYNDISQLAKVPGLYRNAVRTLAYAKKNDRADVVFSAIKRHNIDKRDSYITMAELRRRRCILEGVFHGRG